MMIEKIQEVLDNLLEDKVEVPYAEGFLVETEKYVKEQKEELKEIEKGLKNLRGVLKLKNSLILHNTFKNIFKGWKKH